MTLLKLLKLNLTLCTSLPGTVSLAEVQAAMSRINLTALFSSTGVKSEFYFGELKAEFKMIRNVTDYNYIFQNSNMSSISF